MKEARAKREKGEIDAAALKAIEDREIEKIIKRQEDIGLKAVTDGEFRRAFWNYDFLGALPGIETYLGERKIKFQGVQPRPMVLRVTGKLGVVHHASDDRAFQVRAGAHQAHAEDDDPVAVVACISATAATRCRNRSIRTWTISTATSARPTARPCALSPTPAAAICNSTRSISPISAIPSCASRWRDRGDDPEALPATYAGMINAAISDIPADMTITMHLCRGNFQSTFVAAGGYEPVAEILFNTINVHGYFMEYDSDRAGGFEPLRFVPKGKTVVLGLVTSQVGAAGDRKDELKRRIEEASKFIDLDQLCLSPQCGFASTEEGNMLAEEEQWAKLRMIVEVAEEVWGLATQ